MAELQEYEEALDVESTVICAAGKGEMSAADCLACALKHSPRTWCGYDYALIKRLLTDAHRTGIHVSDLTGCLKRAYLDKVDPQPQFVHEKLIVTLGTVAHSFLEGSDEHLTSEMDLEAMGVVGRADVIYKDGRLVDFKTTRWIYPNKLPYGSHAKQINIYAHLLRKMGHPVTSLAVQYIDMSGPTKCRKCRRAYRSDIQGNLSCPVCGGTTKNAHLGAVLIEIPMEPEEEIEEYIRWKSEELQVALETGIAPPVKPSFLCNYCDHVDGCPEGRQQVGR
jgi:hypothetical protein